MHEPVDRLHGGDRMQWEADTGPFPQHIGAILLPGPTDRSPDDWARTVAERLGAVPALGRRPVRPPPGCGSWVWVDDDRDPFRHVVVEQVAGDGEDDILTRAVERAAERMIPGRSPWRAHVLVGPRGDVVAVVVLLHHALADGLGGLAVLGALVDGMPVPDARAVPPLPDRRALARDTWSRRAQALRRAPAGLLALREARAELGGGQRSRAPRSRLNRRTGPRRDLATVHVPVDPLRAAGHRDGGSLNDALLVAVVGALREIQLGVGEELAELVVSVPVAVTDPDVRATVGNAVGAVPLPVPATGSVRDRVRTVARRRAQLLAGRHGRSLPLILAAFRVLASVGLVDWFAGRQRMVNTLVTNVRGPDRPVAVLGGDVRRIVPLVVNQGNQSVAFAALSYAGTLCVSVITDPDVGPPAREVAAVLRRHLAEVVSG